MNYVSERSGLAKIHAVALAIIIIVAATAGAAYYMLSRPSTPTPTEKMVLYTTWVCDVSSTDPAQGGDSDTFWVVNAAYDRLIDFKPNSSDTFGSLATGWVINPSATEYTFSLRKGVLFADGTPFDASAVKLSFTRLLAIGLRAADFTIVDRIEVLNETAARFVLKYAFAPFLYALTTPAACIVNPKAVAMHNSTDDPWAMNWFNDHTDGTGPYQFVDYVKGAYWRMIRNSNYWQGWEGKHLDEIYCSVLPQETTRYMMMKKGNIDITHNIYDPSLVEDVTATPGIMYHQWPITKSRHFWLNVQSKPLDDVNVRKAIAYAIDYEAVLDVYSGFGVRAGPVYDSFWSYDPTLVLPTRNLTLAEEYLSNSTYTEYTNGGFSLRFLTYTGASLDLAAGQVLQASLKDLNIDVEIEVYAWSVVAELQSKLETAREVCFIGQYSFYPDPQEALYKCFHSSKMGANGRNWMYYNNTQVDYLLDEAMETAEQGARTTMYREIYRILLEDMPACFMVQMTDHLHFQSWVKGFTYYPMFLDSCFGNFYNLYIEGRPD